MFNLKQQNIEQEIFFITWYTRAYLTIIFNYQIFQTSKNIAMLINKSGCIMTLILEKSLGSIVHFVYLDLLGNFFRCTFCEGTFFKWQGI